MFKSEWIELTTIAIRITPAKPSLPHQSHYRLCLQAFRPSGLRA